MSNCPEPNLCKAGDQCAGRCRPPEPAKPKAIFFEEDAKPRSDYFKEQLEE